MKLVVRHLFRDLKEYYVTSFFQELYSKLVDKFPQYSFEVKNDQSYENYGYGSVYSCMNFSIINPDNQKYILFSFFDNWKYHFMKHLGWQPSNMVQFFYPGGFNYIDYFNFKKNEQFNNDIDLPTNITSIYQSFFYGAYEKGSLDLIDELYNQSILDTLPIMYFRGYLWDFRKKMIENIKDNSVKIIDKNNNQNLNYNDYLKDLSQYRCALSLPGGTEVCNRDIECFAIGIPVIRPYLNISYPDPLIPNYHYISCCGDYKYWDGNVDELNINNFAANLIHYWSKIKDNIEYLEFIRTNARNYFLKNCTLHNNINYVLSQIDLELLND